MAYVELKSWKYGLDTRRSQLTSVPGTLQVLNNCHINQGSEIEKRKAFAIFGNLTGSTFGLLQGQSTIYVFGSRLFQWTNCPTTWTGTQNYVTITVGSDGLWPVQYESITITNCSVSQYNGTWQVGSVTGGGGSEALHLGTIAGATSNGTGATVTLNPPTGVTYMTLLHPDGVTQMTAVLSAALFSGLPFVVASFADGNVFAFYNGTLVPDLYSGLTWSGSTTSQSIALSLAAATNTTTNYTATTPSSGVFLITSIPTVTSGTPFTVVSTVKTAGSGTVSLQPISPGIAVNPGTSASGSFIVEAGAGGTNATGTLSFSTIALPANGDTITIGPTGNETVYTFVTNLSVPAVPNQIKIGPIGGGGMSYCWVTMAALCKAILYGKQGNHNPPNYYWDDSISVGTIANTQVTCPDIAASNQIGLNTILFTAIANGSTGNAVNTLATSATVSWSASTLLNGTAGGTVTQIAVGATNLLSTTVPYGGGTANAASALTLAVNLNSSTSGYSAMVDPTNTSRVIISSTTSSGALNGQMISVTSAGVVFYFFYFTCTGVPSANTTNVSQMQVNSTNLMTVPTITFQDAGHSTETMNQWIGRIILNINANSGVSGWTAGQIGSQIYFSRTTSSSGDTIPASGNNHSGNDAGVTWTFTGSFINPIVGLLGGVNPSGGQGAQWQVGLSGTWVSGDTVALVLTVAGTGAQTLIGAGATTGIGLAGSQQLSYCFTYSNKEYLLAGPSVYMSAVAQPTVFNNLTATGDGTITLTNYYSTAENLVAMAPFQGMLAFFSRWTTQIYQINANLANWTFFQMLPNTGTFAPLSVQALGTGMDDLYLSDSGIRTMRPRVATLSAQVVDIGSPIDQLIQTSLLANSAAANAAACAIVEPTSGRYWLYLNGVIYVLSYFEENEIIAWSTYAPTYDTLVTFPNYTTSNQVNYTIGAGVKLFWLPGVNEVSITDGVNTYTTVAYPQGVYFTTAGTTLTVTGTAHPESYTGYLCISQTAFVPQVFVVYNGQVYTRDTSKIYVYGGTNNNTFDSSVAVATTPWLDLEKTVTRKEAEGLDSALTGSWNFTGTLDWFGVTQQGGTPQQINSPTLPITLPTFQAGILPFSGDGYHIQLSASSFGTMPCVLSNMIFTYEEGEAK